MQYDEYGNRKNRTVVLLHGAGVTDTFCRQYCFADCYHLLVPHLYGSGREVLEPYDPQRAVLAVAELIGSLGKDSVSLIGHSIGAELAVALVSQYEYLFDRAVFLSPWVCPSERTVAGLARTAPLSAKLLHIAPLVRRCAHRWHMTEAQTNAFVAYAAKITPEQYRAFFTERIRLDELERYPDVSIPMLAVCGSRETRETRLSMQALGEHNPNCRTLVLEGGRHDYPMRFPERLNPVLLNFLHAR